MTRFPLLGLCLYLYLLLIPVRSLEAQLVASPSPADPCEECRKCFLTVPLKSKFGCHPYNGHTEWVCDVVTGSGGTAEAPSGVVWIDECDKKVCLAYRVIYYKKKSCKQPIPPADQEQIEKMRKLYERLRSRLKLPPLPPQGGGGARGPDPSRGH